MGLPSVGGTLNPTNLAPQRDSLVHETSDLYLNAHHTALIGDCSDIATLQHISDVTVNQQQHVDAAILFYTMYTRAEKTSYFVLRQVSPQLLTLQRLSTQ
uniref:Peroxidase n=1 Tax=Ascaris lumbricoides TaxID=6252 RepID=A0A0M3I2W4_ASCLU